MKSRLLTAEVVCSIVDAYLSGMTARSVATAFGYTESGILSILKRNNIKRRNLVIWEKDFIKIKNLYLSGMNLKEVATIVGCSIATVSRILLKHGIIPRDNKKTHRKNKINVDYFNTIDTEEKAYWLGFITADGSVQRSGHLGLSLKSADKEHLIKFNKCISSDYKIKDYVFVSHFNNKKLTHSSRLSIKSVDLVNSLINLGVVPNKTFSVTPCKKVPKNLERHYWRGVVDGDGWVSFNYNNLKGTYSTVVGLCGNKFIVDGFKKFITSQGVVSKTLVVPAVNIYRIAYGGLGISSSVCNVLYENSSIYLDRKKEKATKIIELKKNKLASCE